MNIKPLVVAVRTTLWFTGLSRQQHHTVFDREHPCDRDMRLHMERVTRFNYQAGVKRTFEEFIAHGESVRFQSLPRSIGKSLVAKMAREEMEKRGYRFLSFSTKPSANTIHAMFIDEEKS